MQTVAAFIMNGTKYLEQKACKTVKRIEITYAPHLLTNKSHKFVFSFVSSAKKHCCWLGNNTFLYKTLIPSIDRLTGIAITTSNSPAPSFTTESEPS